MSVEVTNSGKRPGREVVQLYLRDVVADVTRPLIELADWVSLVLDAGATGTATFTTRPRHGSADRPWEAVVRVGPDASTGV